MNIKFTSTRLNYGERGIRESTEFRTLEIRCFIINLCTSYLYDIISTFYADSRLIRSRYLNEHLFLIIKYPFINNLLFCVNFIY